MNRSMNQKLEARLFVEAELLSGATIELAEGQAHYLRNVLRLKEGQGIALFNGRDGEFSAQIETLERGRARVAVVSQLREQAREADLWLLFAPIKRARIDFLIEKATELGASAIYPVMTRHTMVERVNLARLKANAIEAAEQSERLSVPHIHAPRALDHLLASWEPSRRLMLCDETKTAPPVAVALKAERPGAWAVLVGPEGGFAEDELDALRKLPFVSPVSLGPRILRADTAALAGLALLQAFIGDAAP